MKIILSHFKVLLNLSLRFFMFVNTSRTGVGSLNNFSDFALSIDNNARLLHSSLKILNIS